MEAVRAIAVTPLTVSDGSAALDNSMVILEKRRVLAHRLP